MCVRARVREHAHKHASMCPVVQLLAIKRAHTNAYMQIEVENLTYVHAKEIN